MPRGGLKGAKFKRRAGMSTRLAPSSLRKRVATWKRRQSNSEQPVVSVIIPVFNERRTIAAILRQAYQVHPHTEVIVVANGSSDGTEAIARRMGARVVFYEWPLGHDVGRAIGARMARGRVLLFTDGDIVISAKDMKPLVNAVEKDGVDVALNAYTGPVRKLDVHNVVLAKHALNYALGREDLGGASLTTIPHALSRKAAEWIGPENLAVPPKSLAIAVQRGLKVRAVHHIDVGRRNRHRRRGGSTDPVEHLIVGDHLEALHWIVQHAGPRGGKSDLFRVREFAR